MILILSRTGLGIWAHMNLEERRESEGQRRWKKNLKSVGEKEKKTVRQCLRIVLYRHDSGGFQSPQCCSTQMA